MSDSKIDKIIKLQRLSESSNEHEANAAKRKLEKLLQEIGVNNIYEFKEEWEQDICTIISDFDATNNIGEILHIIKGNEQPDNFWYTFGYTVGVADAMMYVYSDNRPMCHKYRKKYGTGSYDENSCNYIGEEDLDSYIDGNVDGYESVMDLYREEEDGFESLD